MAFLLQVEQGGSWVDFHHEYVQKVKYGDTLVWSPNTRRNAKGKMTGRIVTSKYKLELSYKADLPQAYLQAMRNVAMSNQEWHQVRFTDECGNDVSKVMYFGDYSVEPYWFVNGTMLYQSISFSLIER